MNALNTNDIRTIKHVLAKGGIVAEGSLVVALNEHLLTSGHLVNEHGTVYATAKGCVAVRDHHEHVFVEVSRKSVFDSNGRYRGEHVERECWCGEHRQVPQIIRDCRQRSPHAVL